MADGTGTSADSTKLLIGTLVTATFTFLGVLAPLVATHQATPAISCADERAKAAALFDKHPEDRAPYGASSAAEKVCGINGFLDALKVAKAKPTPVKTSHPSPKVTLPTKPSKTK